MHDPERLSAQQMMLWHMLRGRLSVNAKQSLPVTRCGSYLRLRVGLSSASCFRSSRGDLAPRQNPTSSPGEPLISGQPGALHVGLESSTRSWEDQGKLEHDCSWVFTSMCWPHSAGWAGGLGPGAGDRFKTTVLASMERSAGFDRLEGDKICRPSVLPGRLGGSAFVA